MIIKMKFFEVFKYSGLDNNNKNIEKYLFNKILFNQVQTEEDNF